MFVLIVENRKLHLSYKLRQQSLLSPALSATKSGKGLLAFLTDLTYSHKGIDCKDAKPELWNQDLKAWQHLAGVELPVEIGLETFEDRRLTGWHGELGKPYLVFSVEETLAFKPFEKGKNLQAALDCELAPVNWARLSC